MFIKVYVWHVLLHILRGSSYIRSDKFLVYGNGIISETKKFFKIKKCSLKMKIKSVCGCGKLPPIFVLKVIKLILINKTFRKTLKMNLKFLC